MDFKTALCQLKSNEVMYSHLAESYHQDLSTILICILYNDKKTIKRYKKCYDWKIIDKKKSEKLTLDKLMLLE